MKYTTLLLSLLLITFSALAQNYSSGKVLESLSLSSKILNKDVDYSVYLPPDYEESDRAYPILYLLHGYTDNETAWVQFGEVNYAADAGIRSREVPPMIIVMPDGGVTFYIDDYQGKVKWESMFLQEFMPHIESEYRVRKQKEFRAISGLSMGGYGATVLAMRNPDLFAACVPFSSAYFSDEYMVDMDKEEYESFWGKLYGEGLASEERLTKHWREHSPLHLAKTLPSEALKSIRWYIDCGDDDFLTIGNAEMHTILTEREIPHEFRMRDGGHTWEYWRTGIEDGLRFIAKSFTR